MFYCFNENDVHHHVLCRSTKSSILQYRALLACKTDCYRGQIYVNICSPKFPLLSTFVILYYIAARHNLLIRNVTTIIDRNSVDCVDWVLQIIIYEGQDKNPEMCRVLLTHEIMCRLVVHISQVYSLHYITLHQRFLTWPK